MIDLSTLKAGDKVKFRNGDISEVKRVSFRTNQFYPYFIVFSNKNELTYVKNGSFNLDSASPLDIIEINPIEQTDQPESWHEAQPETEKAEFEASRVNDPVNHPSHYTDRVPGIECIQVVENFNFCRGSAIKYIWRAGLKDPTKEIEDLKKARWLLDREIQRLEN